MYGNQMVQTRQFVEWFSIQMDPNWISDPHYIFQKLLLN